MRRNTRLTNQKRESKARGRDRDNPPVIPAADRAAGYFKGARGLNVWTTSFLGPRRLR